MNFFKYRKRSNFLIEFEQNKRIFLDFQIKIGKGIK
jgi:hypothetical protein